MLVKARRGWRLAATWLGTTQGVGLVVLAVVLAGVIGSISGGSTGGGNGFP